MSDRGEILRVFDKVIKLAVDETANDACAYVKAAESLLRNTDLPISKIERIIDMHGTMVRPVDIGYNTEVRRYESAIYDCILNYRDSYVLFCEAAFAMRGPEVFTALINNIDLALDTSGIKEMLEDRRVDDSAVLKHIRKIKKKSKKVEEKR